MSEGQIFGAFIAAMFIGLLLVAVIVKYVEVQRASRWKAAAAKITSSRVVTRSVRNADNDSEMRNFAEVRYEFRVGQRKVYGDRISIGEDLGNIEVEEKLARYPVGKAVQIYYNPSNPSESVIERDLPPNMFKYMVLFIGGCILLALALIFGPGKLIGLLEGVLPPSGNPLFTVAFALFGTFAALMALGVRADAVRSQSWPSTKGKIVVSQIDDVESSSSETGYFRPTVNFTYVVNGHTYTGSAISTGGTMVSNVAAFAKRDVAKFPVGATVEVFYDPDNPARGVLERKAKGFIFASVCAAVLFALSLWFSGFL